MISSEVDLSEIPTSQRRPLPKPLDYYAQKHQDQAVCAACQSGGYTMKDVANYFDSHYTSVSRIINDKYYAKRKTRPRVADNYKRSDLPFTHN